MKLSDLKDEDIEVVRSLSDIPDSEVEVLQSLDTENTNEISQLESLGRGLSNIGGFQDELAGGLSALGKVAGIKGLGGKLADIELDSPSTPFTEAGRKELADEYNRVKNIELQKQKEAQEANPGTFMLGDIASSFTPVGPANLVMKGAGALKALPQLAKAGETLSGAEKLKNVAKLAGIGAATGAVEGVGRTEGEMSDVLKGSAESAAFGAALPVGIAGAAEGIKKTAKTARDVVFNEKMQELIKEAYRKGEQGLNISKSEFLDDVLQNLTDTSRKIATPIAKRAENLKNFRLKTESAKLSRIDNQIKSKQQEIDKLKDSYVKLNDQSIEAQLSGNLEKQKELQKKLKETSVLLQSKLKSAKDVTQDMYQKVDDVVKNESVPINSIDVVESTIEQGAEFLTPKQIENLKQLSGDLTFEQFQNLKFQLQKIADNPNPIVARFGRSKVGQLRKAQRDSFAVQGRDDLVSLLDNANQRWTGFSNSLDFVDGINLDPITKQIEASPQTASFIRSFNDPLKAEKQIDSENFARFAKSAGVDDSVLSSLSQVADEGRQLNQFKPTKIDIDEQLALDPTNRKLQEELSQLQLDKKIDIPELPQEQAFSRFGVPVEEATKKVSNTLESGLNPFRKASARQDVEDLFSLLNQSASNKTLRLQNEAKDALRDVELGRLMQSEYDNVPLTKYAFLQSLTGGLTRQVADKANLMGRLSTPRTGVSRNTLDAFNKLRPSFEKKYQAATSLFAEDNSRKYTPIYDDEPEEVIRKANDIVSSNPSKGNQFLAEKMVKASQKDSVGKAAATMDLMQTPSGRALLKKQEEESE